MQEAMFYHSHGQTAHCRLCPKHCAIPEGNVGFCQVRCNRAGKLYTQNYALCSSMAVDPIEKKPLYHFYPGSSVFSLGTWGCNFSCQFCQNWQIAQQVPHTVELKPEAAVRSALAAGGQNIGIAFTYSEPSVWYEYVLETAILAQDAGLKTIMVTNGFIESEPFRKLLPHIDAVNIDVKAFEEDFYRKLCAGELAVVKQSVEQAMGHCHVEVTTLLIPELNDRIELLQELAAWLGRLDRNIPLHFSRYFPNYRLELPPTPVSALERARTAANEFLNYVYIGNVNGPGGNTYCPGCKNIVIDRMQKRSWLTKDKQCPRCGRTIAIQGEVRF